MRWEVEYFQEGDDRVPGIAFEERLARSGNPDDRSLVGLLRRWAVYAAEQGPTGDGGGHFEKCRNVGVWQIKASTGRRRGRYFFGWDQDEGRLVLLSGIVKGPRQPTPPAAYSTAQAEWERYLATRRIAREDE